MWEQAHHELVKDGEEFWEKNAKGKLVKFAKQNALSEEDIATLKQWTVEMFDEHTGTKTTNLKIV
jgi:hypothetical protein